MAEIPIYDLRQYIQTYYSAKAEHPPFFCGKDKSSGERNWTATGRPQGKAHGCAESKLHSPPRVNFNKAYRAAGQRRLLLSDSRSCMLKIGTAPPLFSDFEHLPRQAANGGSNDTGPAARLGGLLIPLQDAPEYLLFNGMRRIDFAPLNDKCGGRSRLTGTFLWFVLFVQKK